MNEPDIKLKSVTSRVVLHDYACILQAIEGTDKTVSDAVRECVAAKYGSCELSAKWQSWIDEQIAEASRKRAERRAGRKSRLRRFFNKMMGR